MKEHAIIVAGGSGSRMQSSIPKQFLEIAGKPVLFYTIEAFQKYSSTISIILVLPSDQLNFWQELCQKHKVDFKLQVQSGGNSRFQSVKKGLEVITEDGLVAVHDGVRPLIKPETIRNAFGMARQHGTAVVATSLKESIREKTGQMSIAKDRSRYALVQTPQVFRVSELKRAYTFGEQPYLTDDASVAEAAGIKIRLVDGDYENIKITTPEDVIFAEAIINGRIKKSEL